MVHSVQQTDRVAGSTSPGSWSILKSRVVRRLRHWEGRHEETNSKRYLGNLAQPVGWELCVQYGTRRLQADERVLGSRFWCRSSKRDEQYLRAQHALRLRRLQ